MSLTDPLHASLDARAAVAVSPEHCLRLALDEIDYGMALLGEHLSVLHLNRKAQQELGGTHPLRVHDGRLGATHPTDHAVLQAALDAALRWGVRKLVRLVHGVDAPLTVSVMPLGRGEPQAPPATLLVMGRQAACEALSAHNYALDHGLTQTESQVLSRLVAGDEPAAIAQAHRVAISTVRTQISSIREKTGARSIRSLVQEVATLPPLAPVALMRREPTAWLAAH